MPEWLGIAVPTLLDLTKMNPIRETFHFLFSNRLKHNDPHPAFGALAGTTIFAYLNLLVVTALTDPFTGYFSWFSKQGALALVAATLSGVAIGTVQYFCWIANGRLERARERIEVGELPRPIVVYSYMVLSILALPATGILMHHLGK